MAGRSRDTNTDQAKGAPRAPAVAALDLGQSKVACFIMKPEGVRHADRTIRVAGASHVQSRGVRGGAIVNMDEAAQAIGHAVERAERAAGSPVSGVIVTTAIGQMASHRVQARVSLGAHPISDGDLARAIGMAEQQENVLIFSIARIPEREKRFQWIGPLFPFSESLYKLKTRKDIQLTTLKEAMQYQTGVIRGYAVHELLKREGFADNIHLQLAKDQEQNLRKLFSGKTDLLARVPAAVDLEAHANHRGSSFGALPQGQPGNINFENGLAIELLQRERRGQTHLIMEDESRMIGRCTLPLPLFSTMELAPLILLEAPLAERIARIQRQYVDELLLQFVAQLSDQQAARQALTDFLLQAIGKLERRLGGDRYRLLQGQLVEALQAQFELGDSSGHAIWIERLLTDYYDPLYQRSLRTNSARIVFRGEADACYDYLQQLSFANPPR